MFIWFEECVGNEVCVFGVKNVCWDEVCVLSVKNVC